MLLKTKTETPEIIALQLEEVMNLKRKHNYPDDKALDILKTLRLSQPSEPFIIDRLIGPFHPTEASSAEGQQKITNTFREALSSATDGFHIPVCSQIAPGIYDMVMATLFGDKARTYEQWTDLLSQARYKLVKVCPLRASSGQVVFEAMVMGD